MKKRKLLGLILSVVMVVTMLGGCGGASNNKTSSGDGGSGDGNDLITVGFSQVGSESDWRTANTESMKSTFTEVNGYRLIFDDAQQKQENQLKAIRNFIQQEVDYIVLAPVTESGWDAVLKEAKDADNKMIVFSVFCCVIVAGLMLVVGGFFPQIYNTTEEIKALATSFIAVSAMIMPFCSFSHASYFTLRSGGKTMVTFLFDSVFTWIVVVPAAFVLARFTGLGIVSVYFLVQATELIKVVIGYRMVRSNVCLVQMV